MARPRLIQDHQLLDAARELFLEQGFAATTASIAARAGVSEGTLFKRFSTKEELFVAAMGLTSYGDWRGALLEKVGQGEVQKNLEQAALTILQEADGWVRNMVAVFSRGIDPSHNPVLVQLDHSGRADLSALMDYLLAETERGRVRPHDVEVTAMALLGALTGYMHCRAIPPGSLTAEAALTPGSPAPLPLAAASAGRLLAVPDAGRFVRGVMDVLWPGLKP